MRHIFAVVFLTKSVNETSECLFVSQLFALVFAALVCVNMIIEAHITPTPSWSPMCVVCVCVCVCVKLTN